MSEWRKLAAVPQGQSMRPSPRVQAISQRDNRENQASRSAASSTALWVWGRRMDFDCNGTFAMAAKASRVMEIVIIAPNMDTALRAPYLMSTRRRTAHGPHNETSTRSMFGLSQRD
jgi:hypothetical protein